MAVCRHAGPIVHKIVVRRLASAQLGSIFQIPVTAFNLPFAKCVPPGDLGSFCIFARRNFCKLHMKLGGNLKESREKRGWQSSRFTVLVMNRRTNLERKPYCRQYRAWLGAPLFLLVL